jgi:alpha-1,6-mannosyltransferase
VTARMWQTWKALVPWASAAALFGIVLATGVIAASAATMGRSFVVKAGSGHGPQWLFGPLAGLGPHMDYQRLRFVLIAMVACYFVAVLQPRPVRVRPVAVAIVAAHVLLVLGPPIFSVDIFGYLGYARLDVLHGLNPYAHGVAAAPSDPINAYFPLGPVHSPYGPLWAFLTGPLGHLSIPLGTWLLKIFSALASLGCAALAARVARARDRDPGRACALVGLNPIHLLYGVGGAHNDTYAALLMLGGVWALVADRRSVGARGLVAGAFVKAPAAIAVPFAIAGSRDRLRLTRAVAIAAVVGTVASFAVIGSGLTSYPAALRAQAEITYPTSVLFQIEKLGTGDLTTVATVLFVLIAAGLLITAWRGADWVACAAYAVIAFLLTRGFFAPWYMIGLLVLCAAARGRPAIVAALATTLLSTVLVLGLLN